MAQEFSRQFYSSAAWQACRNTYAAKRGHLCEDCLKRGIYKPGEIVHHVIELDPVNITNPEISLNHANLCLLCRECHSEQHDRRKKDRRYRIGEDGEILCDI